MWGGQDAPLSAPALSKTATVKGTSVGTTGPDQLRSTEHRSLLTVGAAVAGLHLGGWGALLVLVLPAQDQHGGNTAALLALAISAYALGIRHAFDADHITAIDNATRKLLTAGRPTTSTGFWFALGHSSVVMISVLLLAMGLETFTGGLSDENSDLRSAAGTWGATISGLFLLAVGALNLPALLNLHRIRRTLHTGPLNEADLQHHLDHRGVLHRLLRPLSRLVDRPTKMYPIGFLFGLGLDTAASISLFVLTGTLAPGLPWYTVMVLPILFTAGMTLFDSADGILMSRLYHWASADSRRKVTYNLVVTAVSIGVAFLIGGTGLLTVLADLSTSPTGILRAITTINLNFLGLALIMFFTLTCLAARIWRKNKPNPTVLVLHA